MADNKKTSAAEAGGQPGFLRRLWRSRRSFRGFGLLLFYCHMLMLFSFLTRVQLDGLPEFATLLTLGRILVPLLFGLTTLSLFVPRFFWAGLGLGFLHAPVAAGLLLNGAASAAAFNPLPWFAALCGLLALLALSLRIKLAS